MANVLVVDDSSTMRQMVKFTLNEVGHDVVEASDGSSALECINRQAFDLIITDINMPGMDGLQLIKAIRGGESTKRKPILVLTTESDSAIKLKGREAGATGWLIKPFDPRSLIGVLPRVLG